LINTISSLAYSNEVGSFKPDYYDPGRYTVQYTFDIHPPLEYDDDTGHLNLMFASEHIPYRSVIIVFEDSEYIDALYPHPISYKVSKEDNRIVVTGSSGEDELIEVEMLIDLDALEAMDGFPTWVEGVRFRTMIANIDTYENLEKRYNSLLLNFTKLQEDLDEANLEISSTRSELDLVELELEEKRSELSKAYDKITIFQVVALVAFVAGLSLMYIMSKRGKARARASGYEPSCCIPVTSYGKRPTSQRARAVPSQVRKPTDALYFILLSFLVVLSTFIPLYGSLSLSMK